MHRGRVNLKRFWSRNRLVKEDTMPRVSQFKEWRLCSGDSMDKVRSILLGLPRRQSGCCKSPLILYWCGSPCGWRSSFVLASMICTTRLRCTYGFLPSLLWLRFHSLSALECTGLLCATLAMTPSLQSSRPLASRR